MEGGHYFDPFVILEAPAQSRDAFARVEQIFHRGIAQHNDHFRLHDRDLAEQIRFARRRFFSRGSAIAWRTAAVNVSDQHFFTFQTDRFDDLRQQLSGAPDKRACLYVLIRAWRLTDKHQSRFSISFGMDHVLAFEMQWAARAVADFSVDLLERFG